MEDGSVVKATKEHPFLMNDLTYVELQNLKVGDELFSFNIAEESPKNHLEMISKLYTGDSDLYAWQRN